MKIGLKLDEILKLYGFKTILTRKEDVFVTLSKRADIANQAKADLFISIHCNSAKNPNAYGFETYHYPNYPDSRRLANYIQTEIEANKKLYQQKKYANRGVKTAKFTVLQRTSMTAVLVETAFINNTIDAQILKNNTEDFAFAIANATLKYFNINRTNRYEKKYFSDKEHWAYPYCVAINKACEERGIHGINETRFDDKISRGEAMKLVALTLEIQKIDEQEGMK